MDPYEAGALGGAVTLPPLADVFDAVLCTHEHVDHAARHAVPSATDIGSASSYAGIAIDRLTVFHDEFEGELRGGTSEVLRLRSTEGTIVHCGDIGERPTGDTLSWLNQVPIDVLLVPVGGYFTLEPDGAAELVALLKPQVAVPCHSADDGVTLAQLGTRASFVKRFAHDGVEARSELTLPLAPNVRSIVIMQRADSAA